MFHTLPIGFGILVRHAANPNQESTAGAAAQPPAAVGRGDLGFGDAASAVRGVVAPTFGDGGVWLKGAN
jgi:hypothetical protein